MRVGLTFEGGTNIRGWDWVGLAFQGGKRVRLT